MMKTKQNFIINFYREKMENNLKIALIGGTGKSGQYLVKQLIRKGFSFKILVRNSSKLTFQYPKMEIVEGNVADYEAIKTLLSDCQAVISTLGLGIPASEPTIFSQSTTHILQAMSEYHIKRYILTTGLNVDTSLDKKSPQTTMATEWMKANFPVSTANKQLEYEILTKSPLDWTLIRLPIIELTEENWEIKWDLEDCLGDKISATDLANFLISQLSDNQLIRKAPFVFN